MFPFTSSTTACSAASPGLQMICKYYGKEYSLESLSRYCFATTEGVSMLGISEAANKLGLHTICGRVTMEQLPQAPLPLHSALEPEPFCHPLQNKE